MTEQTQPLLTDALARLRHLYSNLMNGGVRDTASAKRIAEGLLSPVIADLVGVRRAMPTQPQAGAVPLTDEQMDAALGSAKKVRPGYVGWVTDQRREWGRAVERAHGIKGGQHGPNN